jgi:predicted hotdog family 3-hydroxylacyl-ACP dehydratase
MTANFEHILKYIPQRPPMVMVDKLLQSDEVKSETELTVRADNIFVENGVLTAPGLTENMAQTAAARAGFTFVENGEAVKLGFIGAIKNLKIHREPAVGSTLKTEIRELAKVMNILAVKTEIRVENELVAECELKIFIQE